MLNIHILKANLMEVKKSKTQISLVTSDKRKAYKQKWCVTDMLPVT